MRKLNLTWTVTQEYTATIDLTDPTYRGLTPEDFRKPPAEVPGRAYEVLTALQSAFTTPLPVDEVEITDAELDRDRYRLRVLPVTPPAEQVPPESQDEAPAAQRYAYRIDRLTGSGESWKWTQREYEEFDSIEEARDFGHARWRALAGPIYVEVAPYGPADAGDAAGDAQVGTAWVRRFARELSSGEGYGVVDVECAVVDAQGDPDGPPRLVLSRTLAYTECTDLADVGGSEVASDTESVDFQLGYVPDEEDAYRMCGEFDPNELDWDGEPLR